MLIIFYIINSKGGPRDLYIGVIIRVSVYIHDELIDPRMHSLNLNEKQQ